MSFEEVAERFLPFFLVRGMVVGRVGGSGRSGGIDRSAGIGRGARSGRLRRGVSSRSPDTAGRRFQPGAKSDHLVTM